MRAAFSAFVFTLKGDGKIFTCWLRLVLYVDHIPEPSLPKNSWRRNENIIALLWIMNPPKKTTRHFSPDECRSELLFNNKHILGFPGRILPPAGALPHPSKIFFISTTPKMSWTSPWRNVVSSRRLSTPLRLSTTAGLADASKTRWPTSTATRFSWCRRRPCAIILCLLLPCCFSQALPLAHALHFVVETRVHYTAYSVKVTFTRVISVIYKERRTTCPSRETTAASHRAGDALLLCVRERAKIVDAVNV